ncbi:DUF4255 domain-containing protein [Aquimarina sp. AD10]|uniref:DUF4255 domain-containing protein n=1 Tax=Aquimarina sp. AD10 TaxID=1714849 RepID=UPI000E4DF6D7|nr:DUF4255 domain-containing protein [Aquimarina sp. AD10]AXT61406.1 DUF4255 domain-containing protein [Aquimarina sp. AD10]RKN01400.1 DUF4255 domain-containing protein [Aquimarina sp. AD10]
MINTVLSVLKDKLNEYLKNLGTTELDVVEFINTNNNDPVSFTDDKVTPFLINVAEDRKFRNADQYSGIIQNGIRTQISPEIRIELQILFVSKFSDYNQALKFLSHVIKFFQVHRVLTPLSAPQLSEENIEKLTIELISLPLEEQNQIWHSLNTSYLPSVLYKIRLLSFIDELSVEFVGKNASEISLNTIEKINK